MFSLPDWAFYPLAAAVTAGMVAGAMSFGESQHRTPAEILSEGVVYDGPTLAALQTGNGLTAEFLEDSNSRFVQISAARGPLDGIQSAGAFFALTEQELRAFEGHRLRITYQIRASAQQGADATRLNLFTPDRGQGSWEEVELSDELASFELDVQSTSCTWPQAYLAVWPDWDSNANTIDLVSIRITALEETPCD